MADLSWAWETEDVVVDDIHRIDASFDDYFRQLPDFLRIDKAFGQHRESMAQQGPHIRLQSYVVNLIANAKRCKFHLPFLLRASVDNTYIFSREACLRAARALISIRDDLVTASSEMWVSNIRLCGLVHISFYGTIVLVMDLICNRNLESEAARKAEISNACRALESAKQQTPAAAMFLDSLSAILRKHRIKLQSREQTDQLAEPSTAPGYGAGCLDNSSGALPNSSIGLENLEFDELWQSYIDIDATIDPLNWDALMNDIETWQPNHQMLEMPEF
ncbi:hypothetical protein LTR09_010449 [Extremus antarcticus]|uniref:Uncharacterized protein n=1 Tax=Extremus antarcticus TaxID=702011 RepID=A0AAJ0D7B3_9PEZI|nr:hypothetical protein LTR09_010449 [Extremus antarcticus]